MKKYIAVLIVGICSIALAAMQIEPVIEKTFKKINDKTIEVTTTTTTVMVDTTKYDRAEVQTDLDHIPKRRAEIQRLYDDQMESLNKEEAELIELLANFK